MTKGAQNIRQIKGVALTDGTYIRAMRALRVQYKWGEKAKIGEHMQTDHFIIYRSQDGSATTVQA